MDGNHSGGTCSPKALIQAAWKLIQSVSHIRDLTPETLKSDREEIKEIRVEDILPSSGTVKIRMEVDDTYYYGMLSDLTGVPLSGEYQLISMIQELAKKKKSYELVEEAMNSVRDTGYGVITPLKEEISLKNPQSLSREASSASRSVRHHPRSTSSARILRPRSHLS